MTDDRHPVRNSIFATVVAGVVLAFVLWLGGFLPTAWSWLWTTTPVPGWAIVGGGLMALLGLLVLLGGLLGREPEPPAWRSFTEMRFKGVLWRWQWSLSNSLIGVHPRCPTDLTQLVFTDVSAYPAARRFHLACQTCGFESQPFRSIEDMEQAVGIEIDRRVASGDWLRPEAGEPDSEAEASAGKLPARLNHGARRAN